MRKALALAVVIVALSMTGCAQEAPVASPSPADDVETPTPTPTPTPDPVRPALSELIVYPGGLDYMKVGVPVEVRDPSVAIVAYNDASCFEIDPNYIVGWEPTYEGEPFSTVTNPDRTIRGIIVADAAIRTSEGIGRGSSRAEVVAAYPSATMTSNSFTDTYAVSGPDGVLNIELATSRDSGELADKAETVLWMVATSSDQAGSYYAYGHYGPCG